MGVSATTISRAEQHIATVDRYPFMENWSQRQVLEAAERLRALSADERDVLVAILSQTGVGEDTALGPRIIRTMASFSSAKRARIVRLYRSDDPRERSLAATTLAAVPPEPDPHVKLLRDCTEALNRAAKLLTRAATMFPNDKYTPALRALACEVAGLKADIARESSGGGD